LRYYLLLNIGLSKRSTRRWRTRAKSSPYRWRSLLIRAWKSVGFCLSMSASSFSDSSWWYYLWS